MSQSENKNQEFQKLEELFQKARKSRVEAPAYMATRVLAQFHEKQAGRWKIRLWQGLSAFSVAMACVLAVMLYQKIDGGFEAEINQPYVVRVEVGQASGFEIVEAEIILPENVEFYSESMPELSAERSLTLAVNGGMSLDHLPFVIKGSKDGRQKIKVRFFDDKQQVVMEKEIEIKFLSSDLTRVSG